MRSFILGSAPMVLKIPEFDRLICIAASIHDIERVPDLTIIETHVLGQSSRRENIRGHKTKKLLVINSGCWNRTALFSKLLKYDDYEEITPYKRRKLVEEITGLDIDTSCGVYALCRELKLKNKVFANRISFTRRQDALAYEKLKENFIWLK